MDRVFIFTESLISKKLQIPELNKKLLLYLDKEKENNKGRTLSNVGGFQTENVKDEFICKTILTEVTQMLTKTYDLKNLNFTLANIWINENNKGDYNAMHIHASSNFSGVYYVKVPKNSGDLVFSRSDTSVEWSETWRFMNNTETFTTNTIKSEENTLLIFPSHLQHWVTPNQSEQSRVSVSFNIWLNN